MIANDTRNRTVIGDVNLLCDETYDSKGYSGIFSCSENRRFKAEVELKRVKDPSRMLLPTDTSWFYFTDFKLGPEKPEILAEHAISNVIDFAKKYNIALFHEVMFPEQRKLKQLMEKMTRRGSSGEKCLDKLRQRLVGLKADIIGGISIDRIVELHLEKGFQRWESRPNTVLYYPNNAVVVGE